MIFSVQLLTRSYFIALLLLLLIPACRTAKQVPPQSNLETVRVFPDSVLNDVSNHPVGINLDYLMDDDRYLNPKRRTADALKAMGVKYLRYPGAFASHDPDQKALFLYLLNVSDEPKKIEPLFEGYEIKEIRQAWELVGENAEDTNPVWRSVSEKLNRNLQIVPGTSIRVVEFTLK